MVPTSWRVQEGGGAMALIGPRHQSVLDPHATSDTLLASLWHGDDTAEASHAPGGRPCTPYQRRRRSLRAREPLSNTASHLCKAVL